MIPLHLVKMKTPELFLMKPTPVVDSQQKPLMAPTPVADNQQKLLTAPTPAADGQQKPLALPTPAADSQQKSLALPTLRWIQGRNFHLGRLSIERHLHPGRFALRSHLHRCSRASLDRPFLCLLGKLHWTKLIEYFVPPSFCGVFGFLECPNAL